MKSVLMIGLPYFTSNVKLNLSGYDKSNKYIALNTYYSKIDKIKYLFLLPFCHTVYSINGTIEHSFAISLALMLKKKVVFHWVGSDVKAAQKAFAENNFDKKFIEKVTHLTDTPWYVEELKQIGIKARFQSLIVLKRTNEKLPLPAFFSALIYIPQNSQEFYGIYRLKNIAEHLPGIQFEVIGTKNPIIPMPKNVVFHGWVKNTYTYIQNSCVCLRFPEHDGLSFFVLESLLLQRYVIYNQKLDFTIYALNDNEIIEHIVRLKEQFDKGILNPNTKASEWVEKNFSADNFIKLIDYLTK
ncbi:MAG: hypothetical protein ACUVQP_06775 [Bacteroidales bacterium]